MEATYAQAGRYYYTRNAPAWAKKSRKEPVGAFFTGYIDVREKKYHSEKTVTLLGYGTGIRRFPLTPDFDEVITNEWLVVELSRKALNVVPVKDIPLPGHIIDEDVLDA